MTVKRALKEAWALYRAHPGDMFLFMLLQIAIRLIALCPLLFLFAPGLRFCALLCVPLWVLIVLPARQRAAEVMQTAIRGGSIFAKRLLIGPDWGKHVLQGVKMTLFLLLWLLPFLAAAAVIVYCYTGPVDVTIPLKWIKDSLGGGDLMNGIVPFALIFLSTLIPFVVGLAFHSGRRHERALSDRRFLRRRHGVMAAWFAGLITLLPFLAATAFTLVRYLMSVLNAVVTMFNNFEDKVTLPDPGSQALLVAGAFVVLLLPLLPLKSLITACYVHGRWEGRE